jgi:hypothetical protein
MNNKINYFTRLALGILLVEGASYVPIFAKESAYEEDTGMEQSRSSGDTICETQYLEEVLDLCRDDDISVPEITPPSGLQVWFTKWGIALFYRLHDAKDWISQKIFGDRRKRFSSRPPLG